MIVKRQALRYPLFPQRERGVRQIVYHSILAAILVVLGSSARAQDVRLANGVAIKGSVLKSDDSGLEVQTQVGPRTYTWDTLSPATRYRHQPKFRANYEAVLQGLPPSAWTNLPDVTTPVPVATPVATNVVPSKDTQAEAGSLLIFDQASYDNVDPIPVAKFPGLQLRAPAEASYVGIQYGPKSADVLYAAFDTKGGGEIRDVAFLYSPGNPQYSNTVRVTGFKRGAGDARQVTFKKVNISTPFGSVQTSLDIEFVYLPGQSNQVNVTVNVDLSKENTRSKFILNGPLTDLLVGDGLITIKGLLDLPMLWVTLDLTAGSPRLVGNLNMSHLKMAPKEGMDARINIEVTTPDGVSVQKDSLKIDEAGFGQQYNVAYDLRKTSPGQTYVVKASINLGPFLGPATFEDKFTIPGGAK